MLNPLGLGPAVRLQMIPRQFSYHDALSCLTLPDQYRLYHSPSNVCLMIDTNIVHPLAHRDACVDAYTHMHTLMHYEERMYKIPLIPLPPSISPLSDLT